MAAVNETPVVAGRDQPNPQTPCVAPSPRRSLDGVNVRISGDYEVSGASIEHPANDRVTIGLRFGGVGIFSGRSTSGAVFQRELIGQQVYLVPPATSHITHQEVKAERLYVYMEPTVWRREARQDVPDVMMVEAALHDSITWRIAYLCRDLSYSRRAPNPELVDLVGGSLACQLGELLSGTPALLGRRLTPEQWQRVITYALSELRHGIGVPDLAKRAGLSTAHFTELFTNTAGESPYQFIKRLRMLRAHLLLVQGKLSGEEIAQAVGYTRLEDLGTMFRQFWGYSMQEVLATVPGASATRLQ